MSFHFMPLNDMALRVPHKYLFPTPVLKINALAVDAFLTFRQSNRHKHLRFPATSGFPIHETVLRFPTLTVRYSGAADGEKEKDMIGDLNPTVNVDKSGKQSSGNDDDEPFLMTDEEREEMRRRIRKVIEMSPPVEEEQDPEVKRKIMQKLLAEYPLVVEEEDPDFPEDADGWGFNLDQFFNKITIKNVKRDNDDDDEGFDSDKEVVWQDDDYIKPIRDITTQEWEDTVFKDFNPLVILVHNRYKQPRENERARSELEKAVKMFWESGLPSPRCVAVDAIVEQDLVSALKVSTFPEILFTKAGKILHRDKVIRTADEWSKIMAFFYYKAVRPPCFDEMVGQHQEKIPALS